MLILLLQQFDKVLVFGILDSLSLSYFAIAFMMSTAIPHIVSPIVLYLTPEIYETVELEAKDQKKKNSILIIAHFIILFICMLILNLYLGQILEVWLGKNIDSNEISSFLIPLSINTLSIYLINSLKIFFIAENKIIFMKKPLMIVFYILILLTVLIYLGFLTIQLYLYCYSFLMFCLMFHLYFKFFIKRSV